MSAAADGELPDPVPEPACPEAEPERFEAWLARHCKAAGFRLAVGFTVALAAERFGGAIRGAVRTRKGDWSPPRLPGGAPKIDELVRGLISHRAFRVGLWAAASGLSYAATKRATGSAAVAGAVAGSTVALLGPLRGTVIDPVELSLHAAVRAGEHVASSAHASALLPPLLREHSGTLVFVGACTQIMFSWFYQPDALPRSYRVWIDRMADMDPRLLTALRQLRSGRVRYGRASPILREYCLDHHLDPGRADLVHGHIPCALVHPCSGERCSHNLAARAWRGAKAAAMVYLPVHAIGAAVAAGPKMAAAAREGRGARFLAEALLRVGSNTARSSAFLGAFIGLVWYGVCLTRGAFRSDLTLGPLVGSFLCGWSVLLEAKRRRGELAMFTLPRALHALWFGLKSSGLGLRDVPLFHVALAAAAGAALAPDWQSEEKARRLKPVVRLVLWLALGSN